MFDFVKRIRSAFAPKRPPFVPTPMPVEPLLAVRDEYDALPRGPKGVRRKRNAVRDLAARHDMTVAELMSAVRKH